MYLALTLANGQVAATPTAIYTGVQSDFVTIRYRNTSGSTTEVVETTVLRAGGTARKLTRLTLAPNCSAVIANIPLQSTDIVKATTTNATTVDYDMTGIGGLASDPNAPLYAVYSYDTNGALNTAAGTTSAATLTGTTSVIGKIFTTSPQPTDTYASAMTIDVSYGMHVIAAANGTSATVTMTPSGAGTAGDKLTIVTATDASGTVTATFASTFKTSGTQATTASKFSTIHFVSDGTRWLETGRVTAMT